MENVNKILMNEKNRDIHINLIELIDNFSVMIYDRENDELHELLISMIEKLDLIINLESTLMLENNNLKIYIEELMSKLPWLLDAFENSDSLLVSDILKYEIKPILKKFIENKVIN